MSQDDSLTPYQLPFPTEALEEIVVPDAAALDEREWVPQAKNVWSRPNKAATTIIMKPLPRL